MTATKTLGRYSLKEHIATGGMAEIWLAEQSGPAGFNRELVIKRILPHLAQDQQFTAMFLDEANLAAQLSHPKIAQIYELGQVDGEFFIAMEFIDGLDVSQLLEMVRDRGQFVPIPIACKIIADVLEALDYAHDFTDKAGNPYQLVHRDISPQNVLVSNDGVVKLVDFGVAKAAANQSKTQPGGVKGKFAYMAPEQIQSRDIDRRVDIFAAGMVFYEILTLTRPFGDDLQAVTGIISLDTPNPQDIRPDIPQTVVDIIEHATEKDPAKRYGEAHMMFRDIQSAMQQLGEFVTDRDVSAFIRTLRGLPTVRTSQTNIQTDGPVMPNPTPVPTATTPVPNMLHTGPTPHVPNNPQEVLQQPSLTPPGMDYVEQSTPYTAELPMVEEKNTGLVVALFGVVILVVAVIGGLIYYLAQNPNDDTPPKEDPKTVVEKEDPKTQKPQNPLQQEVGLYVSLKSKPKSTIYFKGEMVGKTPFDAKLPPGSYTVEFEVKGKRVSKTFKVEAGKPVQRFNFKL